MNPPFSIGQKVVCVKGPQWGPLAKGQIVEVAEMLPCDCGAWFVGLAGPIHTIDGYATCTDCGYVHPHTHHRGGPHWAFAPIQTEYVDATAEIIEKFKSPVESPDKILIPELA